MNDTFLSCDWGTSSFRLRLVDTASITAMAESYSGEGVAHVFEKWQQDKSTTDRSLFYQAVLRRHIAKIEAGLNLSLQAVPIVISGMASSTIGIKELPYKGLPFAASGNDLYYETWAGTPQFSNPIILISGARTEKDVMRGEETQLAGCMLQAGNQQQVFVFPGTHSKHIYVQNGNAIHFETYMTGELFQLLSQNSILSKSVVAGGDIADRNNEAAFTQAVLDSQHHPLLHAAFGVRTNDLFQRFSKEANYWYLSGLLIGAELSPLLQKSSTIAIAGAGSIAQSYQLACNTLGLEAGLLDVSQALLRAHAMILKKALAK